jgi:hypothetical protein|tara:strand:- start:54 stop:965 length:912 start_codon:yes stop_codon:yes gene_type:complete
MAYKQKGCTPITAKIQKGTKGGVTNPLLKAMGVPMKKNPSVAKQTEPNDFGAQYDAQQKAKTDKAAQALKSKNERGVADYNKRLDQYRSNVLGSDTNIKNAASNKNHKLMESSMRAAANKEKSIKQFETNLFNYDTKKDSNLTKGYDAKSYAMSKARGEKKKTEPVKENSTGGGKITGKIGSDLRKAEYDKKGWKYDDTIKGYNKSGNKIKTSTSKSKTADVRAPKVNMDSKLTKAPSYDTSKITGKPKASATAKPSKKVNRKQKAIDVKLTKAKAARASGNDRKADRKERAAQRKKDRLARK